MLLIIAPSFQVYRLGFESPRNYGGDALRRTLINAPKWTYRWISGILFFVIRWMGIGSVFNNDGAVTIIETVVSIVTGKKKQSASAAAASAAVAGLAATGAASLAAVTDTAASTAAAAAAAAAVAVAAGSGRGLTRQLEGIGPALYPGRQ